jgi:hypothetical protein
MTPHDLVYRPFDFVQHEMIINGTRFSLDKINKAKASFTNQKFKAKRIGIKPPENLVFNLKYSTISYQ